MTKRYLNTPEEVVDALKEGKVVLDRTGNKYKSINGFIVVSYISGGWGVDPFIGNHEGLYVDEPEPVKLEVGKFYKTRAGLKVVVLHIDENSSDGCPVRVAVFDNIYDPYCVKETGEYANCSNSVWDIVAPWEE